MKIGILTLPLTNNYGGHLQAWALQTVLKREGHDAILLDIRRSDEKTYNLMMPAKLFLANFIKFLPNKKDYHYFDYRKYQDLHFQNFRDLFLKKTKKIYGRHQLKMVFNREEFDAIIVGSDQVWRKWNMIPLDLYFLSWLNPDINRIGYAISYGKDKWDLSENDTKRYSNLAKLFSGLSMREMDGIVMTKEYFGLDSKLVLDPTMLLDIPDYECLYSNDYISKKGIFYYILDSTDKKKNIISFCSEIMEQPVFKVMPKVRWFDTMKKFSKTDYIYPSIGEWLSAFQSSSFVITDSFHGTVFSIIFNKPFIVIGNEYRGLSRIRSLLQLFNLENRLVSNFEKGYIKDLLISPIDWNKINQTREKWKSISIDFINEHLTNKV